MRTLEHPQLKHIIADVNLFLIFLGKREISFKESELFYEAQHEYIARFKGEKVTKDSKNVNIK